jgi:hypothetical protein
VPLARKNPFTSDGIAATRVPEKQNAPMTPDFEFKHAKSASNKPIAGRGLVQAGNSRIDAIPSEFILNNPTVTIPMAPSKSTLEALAHVDGTPPVSALSKCSLMIARPKITRLEATEPAQFY